MKKGTTGTTHARVAAGADGRIMSSRRRAAPREKRRRSNSRMVAAGPRRHGTSHGCVMIAEHRLMIDHSENRLVALDHAEFETGAFFDGVHTVLEVGDFGFEREIALRELGVFL